MAERRFLVLGLGSFGAELARKLAENGCQVTGADREQRFVDEIKNEIYAAVVADVTDRESLEELLVSEMDAVFISLGEDTEPSLLAALHCKDLNAKQVYVKCVTDEHGRILEKLGVEHVVFPEKMIAKQLADRATWPNVLDRIAVDLDYELMEITVPNRLVGKTLSESRIRQDYNVLVLAVKDALKGDIDANPKSDLVLSDDQLLLVIGNREDLNGLALA